MVMMMVRVGVRIWVVACGEGEREEEGGEIELSLAASRIDHGERKGRDVLDGAHADRQHRQDHHCRHDAEGEAS